MRRIDPGTLALTAMIALCPLAARANFLFDPDAPVMPAADRAEPMADAETQRMAFDMEHASCKDLMALEEDIRKAFLVTSMFLQRKGSLSKIVGPDCMFLGEAVRIASIEDPALTIDDDREGLFHLVEMDALIVSDTRKDSVAYGMPLNGYTGDPVEYFLLHRSEAEDSAAIARIFASTVAVERGAPALTPLPEPPEEPAPAPPPSSSTPGGSSSATTSAVVPRPAEPEPSFDMPDEAQEEPGAVFGESTSEAGEPPQGETVALEEPSTADGYVRPIGPEPESPAPPTNAGIWIVAVFFTLIGIGVLVLVLRNQVSAKQGYVDEQ